jgi:hypothetical protein
VRCPKCKNMLLQKSDRGTRVRTKGPLTFSQDGACRAQCYWCGEAVTVPLELRKAAERFVLGPNNGA